MRRRSQVRQVRRAPEIRRVSIVSAHSATRPPPAFPPGLQRFADEPDVQARFALDVAQARAVVPSGEAPSRPWYLIPGADSLCFFDGEGGACSSLADAGQGRLISVLRPPGAVAGDAGRPPAQGPTDVDPDSVTIQGVAPDGVTSVEATDADGQSVSVVVSDGVYELTGHALQTVHFTGENAPADISLG